MLIKLGRMVINLKENELNEEIHHYKQIKVLKKLS
jgi:hypothetical protein